ncbi:hypothetical protein [Flavobacterium sp.]|uniref:VirB4 family type IV secretion system protein n=1 Tax=Flavobacterium sp. TaxID=239 RepID=UPI0026040CA9|nr:hypothetical protein [Flavobacterium sp.]
MSGKEAALSELAPWISPVTDGLVLQKDGSLLACYSVAGVDIDTKAENSLDKARIDLDHATSLLGQNTTLFWRLEHKRKDPVRRGEFRNDIEDYIDQKYVAHLTNKGFYDNKQHVSILATPETGMHKFFSKVSHHVENGTNIVKAVFKAAKESILTASVFAFSQTELQSRIKDFENKLNSFEGASSAIGVKRLRMQEQYGLLRNSLNPSMQPRDVAYPETLLDVAFVESKIVFGRDTGLMETIYGTKYFSIIAVNEMPRFTSSGVLDSLLALDEEFTITTMYRQLGVKGSEDTLQSIVRHYKLTQLNLRNILKIVLKANTEVDEGRLTLASEASEALKRITSEKLQFGFANTSIMVIRDTKEDLEYSVGKIGRALNNLKIGPVRETQNLAAAFASSLPGCWAEQERLLLLSTQNISDLAPLSSAFEGSPINAWLTDQMGKDMPALTVMPTRLKTLTNINFHNSGGLGNLLIIGPSGAGKSIFANFLTAQTGRYSPRRYTFDRDRSCRIATLLNDGKFIDITGKYGESTPLNPLSLLLKGPQHITFVSNWIQYAMEAYGNGFLCSAKDIECISNTTAMFYESVKINPDFCRLINYSASLPDERLRTQLSPWVGAGKDAKFFDHIEDGFELADELCIEMGELLDQYPQAAALAIDYIFYRIEDSLKEGDPRPTYIKIEEGSFFIKDPVFSKKLNGSAVTIRKKNGNIWLATQSLQHIKEAPGFIVLQENFQNKIYLPNVDASESLYCNFFNLSSRQLSMIQNAIPNQDYILVTPNMTRQMIGRFPIEIVAACRSDDRAQLCFDRHHTSGNPNWKMNYINEMSRE